MRIPRVYAEQSLRPHDELMLEPDSAHYLTQVLRLKVGAPLILFNGMGGEYSGKIQAIVGRQVTVATLDHEAIERESPLAITLVQGISKGDRMDYTFQKAVELGVSRLIPVFCERSVVHLSGERAERRTAHWRGVVRSACEQCARNRLPAVDDPQPLPRYFQTLTGEPIRLVLDPVRGIPLRALAQQVDQPSQLVMLVGSEGGLSETEVNAALAAGFTPITLGPRVLRTETAGVAALAAAQALWGDF